MTDPRIDAAESLVERVMRLEELVRWLSRPYAYEEIQDDGTTRWVCNEPVWTFVDPVSGRLDHNERLCRTWREVVDYPPPRRLTNVNVHISTGNPQETS
jgi:hypothetical protein